VRSGVRASRVVCVWANAHGRSFIALLACSAGGWRRIESNSDDSHRYTAPFQAINSSSIPKAPRAANENERGASTNGLRPSCQNSAKQKVACSSQFLICASCAAHHFFDRLPPSRFAGHAVPGRGARKMPAKAILVPA